MRNFYKDLFACRNDNTDQDLEIENVLNSISSNLKLDEENKSHLEGELSNSEILTVLKKMENTKSPGSDGFTAEFFFIFL